MGNFHCLNNFDPLDVKLNTLFELPKFGAGAKNTQNYQTVTGDLKFSNSCNGLLCYHYDGHHRFAVIWNPCTSEVIAIQALATSDYCRYGLGFSKTANKYKLLRVVSQRVKGSFRENVVAEICTMKKGCSWKSLGSCPSEYGSDEDPLHATFLHGTLHWPNSMHGSAFSILTFDFEDEQFGRVPLPPAFGKCKLDLVRLCQVGELIGCLFITEYTSEGMNIWLMKEYGVQDSWTKMSFLPCIEKGERLRHIRSLPVTCMENGEILYARSEHTSTVVFLYKADLEGFRFVGSGPAFLRVIAYRPSLVLLKDSMLGFKVHVSALKYREMSTTPDWWTLITGYPSVEEERKGHAGATSESSAPPKSSIAMSAQHTSAAELANPHGSLIPPVTNEIRVSALMKDTMERIKAMTEEVMEKQRKEVQEFEERLRNEFVKIVEPFKEQIEQSKKRNQQLEERLQDEKAKVKQMKDKMQQSEQLEQQNRQLRERLQNKVKLLEEKLQQSEQLKEESRQMTIQMMDEMKARFMGSR